jgi:3-ketosteroid 9alpha-monooxygenase subunit B
VAGSTASLDAAFSTPTMSVRDHSFHPLRIARVVHETADASSYVLDVPAEIADGFAYEAGQFLTFRVDVGGEQYLRSYSMSSSPAVGDELQITVKRVPGGVVSNWMNDTLTPGDEIHATYPAGAFILSPARGDLVAFAGGSGITPVLSILKTALSSTSRAVRLLYANRDIESVIFASHLEALVERFGDRLVVEHHSDVERGFVDGEEVRRFLADPSDADFYVCGPGAFMDIVERTLLATGIEAERIHIERFTPPEPDLQETADHAPEVVQVTIELNGRTAVAQYRHGTTLLQTARSLDLRPPSSCESGNCATCMARVVEGSAVMRTNMALTAEEVADGWVLTCQAVPTSSAVHVVYE